MMLSPKLKMTLVVVVALCVGTAVGFHDKAARNRVYLNLLTLSDSPLLRRGAPTLERIGLIGRAVATVDDGLRLDLDPQDFVDQALLATGRWEDDSWGVIESHLPRSGVLIDVGAHIGYYSIRAAQKVGPGGLVIAVEPNPDTLVRLRRNIELNGVGAVIAVEPVAASDRHDTLRLFLSPRLNTGRTSLSESNAEWDGPARPVEVEAVPLDDLVHKSGAARVDVIKMDIEGAELTALRGATRTLEEFKPVLVLEVIDHHLRNMATSEAELRAWLQGVGYTTRQTLSGNNEVFGPADE